MTGVKGVPENITVMFLNPTSVRVSWSTSQVDKVEKYDVSYKPTDARCVPKISVMYNHAYANIPIWKHKDFQNYKGNVMNILKNENVNSNQLQKVINNFVLQNVGTA